MAVEGISYIGEFSMMTRRKFEFKRRGVREEKEPENLPRFKFTYKKPRCIVRKVYFTGFIFHSNQTTTRPSRAPERRRTATAPSSGV